jgi:hypothetical protein
MNTSMTVVGTPNQLVQKGPKLREAIEESDTNGDRYTIDRLELIEADMLQD